MNYTHEVGRWLVWIAVLQTLIQLATLLCLLV